MPGKVVPDNGEHARALTEMELLGKCDRLVTTRYHLVFKAHRLVYHSTLGSRVTTRYHLVTTRASRIRVTRV